MANPTFNINDLVTPVGRTPAAPFNLPSLAEQARTTLKKQTTPAPTGRPTSLQNTEAPAYAT